MNKIEHEGMGTCARIEISQNADNADQKVKWFLEVHKHTNFCAKPIFNCLFRQVFILIHILEIFRFSITRSFWITLKRYIHPS